MAQMTEAEAVGEESGVQETQDSQEVSQDVLDHISDVFAQADGPSAREVGRRASAAKEQTDELVEEGLESEDPSNQTGEEPEAEAEATEEQQPVEEAQEPTPKLDPNLRFAAQQFGWKDDAIDALYSANADLATQTFENLLNAFTALSRQSGWTAAQPQNAGPQTAQPAAQPQASKSRLDEIFGGLKQFSEENGDSLGGFVKALHEELVVPFRQLQAEAVLAKEQAIRAEAMTTINTLAQQFGDVYGADESKLTLVHNQARQHLAQVADAIRAGEQAQGRHMSVADALKRAHLIVTADRRKEEGRREVRQQVQKRSKQITARPTQRRKPGAAGSGRSDSAAMEAFERRAHELGVELGD